MGRERLQIQLEVPFCPGRCGFCSRPSLGQNIGYLQRYRMALERELAAASEELADYEITSVHLRCDGLSLFGVGALDDFLRKLRAAIPDGGGAEWTVDLLPPELTDELLHVLVTRHRIGALRLRLMALEKEELRALHLPFSSNLAEHALDYLASAQERGAALPELSVLLGIGIPGQTPESFSATLERVLALAPRQIELLRFRDRRMDQQSQLAYAEETDWAAFLETARQCAAGYARIGRSLIFAREGEALHAESEEARGESVMGFGLGAVTRLDGLSYRNTRDFTLYVEHADEPEVIAELL